MDLQISMNIKRYYYAFDNSLLFTREHSEHYTNLSTLNLNVRFFRVSTGALA